MRDATEVQELWSIGYKAALLLFAVRPFVTSDSSLTPWVVFYLLLYLSSNLLFYIIKKESVRPAAAALIIAIVFSVALQDYPLFFILLPVHVYELSSMFAGKKGIAAFLLMLIPLIFVPPQLLPLYMLIALVTLMYFSMFERFGGKLREQSAGLDRMRNDLDRLQTRLRENDEFLRQTEYTHKLEERNRLSQNIHDNIGHAMTGALIQMEAAKRLIRTDPGKSASLLDNAIHISKEGIESIRSDLKRMKPATEQLGINRMKLFIDEFSAKHAVKTILTHEGNIDSITPIQWKIIMENGREALTNMLKYSGAASVSIRIQVLNTLIKFEVSDNGKGTQKLIKGLGIIGMEERAASVNGKVVVDGSHGFSVTTLLPYGEK
ncbi:sensor histidine kinase [Paenibacillus contaminans]|uniref:histidine kinase n=1 Tax=Paenibacillus contaminans TaxID=450362 RepID=A0A329MHU8_9BACL|nr:histidine kinase [Paenibacillus contaminans]RAV19435.1 sensor histidine kinase [Paenibacillus contaminans]